MNDDTRCVMSIDDVHTGRVRVGDQLRECKFSHVTLSRWRFLDGGVHTPGIFEVQPWAPYRIAAYDQAMAGWRKKRALQPVRRLTREPAMRSRVVWLNGERSRATLAWYRIASRIDAWLARPSCLSLAITYNEFMASPGYIESDPSLLTPWD